MLQKGIAACQVYFEASMNFLRGVPILTLQRHQTRCELAIHAYIEELLEKLRRNIEDKVTGVEDIVVVSGASPHAYGTH